MKRVSSALLLLTISVVACGDLGDANRRPALAVVEGELRQADAGGAAQPTNVRIAVIWTTNNTGYASTYDVPATPVFPSKFRVALDAPPPMEAMLRYPAGGSGRAEPGDLAMAVGTVVAYEDTNGNRQLDLIDLIGATTPADRILGASESLSLVYLEGNLEGGLPFNAVFAGTPRPGYNLLRSETCSPSATPAPCEPPTWLPMTALYDLPLTASPRFAELMCRRADGSYEEQRNVPARGEPLPAAPGPDGWPKKDAPVLCAPDGKRYSLMTCETSSLGLCRGSTRTCTEYSWGLPTMPSPEWPCPAP